MSNWEDRIIGPALESFLAAVDKQLASAGVRRNAAVDAELVELRRRVDTLDSNTRQQIRQHEWQAKRNARRKNNAKECNHAQARPQ